MVDRMTQMVLPSSSIDLNVICTRGVELVMSFRTTLYRRRRVSGISKVGFQLSRPLSLLSSHRPLPCPSALPINTRQPTRYTPTDALCGEHILEFVAGLVRHDPVAFEGRNDIGFRCHR